MENKELDIRKEIEKNLENFENKLLLIYWQLIKEHLENDQLLCNIEEYISNLEFEYDGFWEHWSNVLGKIELTGDIYDVLNEHAQEHIEFFEEWMQTEGPEPLI